MHKYLNTSTLSILSLSLILFSGCKKDEKVHSSNAVILSGTNPGLNTCGWIIRLNEDATVTSPENSFKPLNLGQQYQTNNLHIKITYTIPDMNAIKCGSNSDNLPGYTQINILTIEQVN